MFGVDIGDDADFRRQARECAVAFVGFNNHPLALAKPRVRTPGVDDAAGDDGRLLTGFCENMRQQRSGRGFAVRARYRNG